MRHKRIALLLSAVVVAGLLALNLRAQLRTNEKLDTLAAALAARSGLPAAAEPVAVSLPPAGVVPRELSGRVALPPYVIEAPDVLTIEAALKLPEPGKVERLPDQPISGQFPVRPDGTVGLGLWGSVLVSGLTTDQAADAIRKHLAKAAPAELAADKLAVSVDVLAYNSKHYYVVADAHGRGQTVVRLPITGSETVLDAVSQVYGLTPVTANDTVRVVRQTSRGVPQTLPVDWKAIIEQGVTATNYQLLPSDRVYVTKASD